MFVEETAKVLPDNCIVRNQILELIGILDLHVHEGLFPGAGEFERRSCPHLDNPSMVWCQVFFIGFADRGTHLLVPLVDQQLEEAAHEVAEPPHADEGPSR